MKKLMVFVLTTILLTSGLPANAAIKAGTACKTSGQIKVSGGKEFTCVKNGSKLVWSKGKVVVISKKVNKTPAPAESPSATPITTAQVKMLSLEASLDSDSILRLQLKEDGSLIECASFLTYPWGVADSYEGVFYRQSREYLIPINLLSTEDLPNSFTYHCPDYTVKSYSI